MKQLLQAIRRAPKLSGSLAILFGVLVVPAALMAWGPDRPTFTMEKPASYVTFNSITNNPKHGDERNFVQIRNYTDNGKFGENVNLVPGKEYEVYVYVHNNASNHLNDAKHDYKGVAKDTTLKVQMPATVKAGDKARVGGTISASNAKPTSVWDEAYGKNTSNGAVALRYVPNSAKVTSEGAVNGQSLDLNKLASSGALLGYDKLDGKIPGCMEYTSYVTYRFKVDQPNFEVTKQVSQANKNDFKDNLKAQPGETVDFRIHYKNTGTVTQENVSLRDDLPKGLEFVEGSAKYFNSKTNGVWKAVDNQKALVGNGIDFGAYSPNGGLYVAFKARVASADKLECGNNKLVNRAVVTTKNGTLHDTATVTVDKTCEEQPEPEEETVKVCDTEAGKVTTVSQADYQANKDRYTTNLSQCGEKEQPAVTELPETGLAQTVGSLLGLGALTTAAYYYVASRRQ